MNNRAVFVLCLLAAPGVAAAADGDEWYATPFIGGVVPDPSRDVAHNYLGYGAAFGRELGPLLNIELSGNEADPVTRYGLPYGHMNLDGLSLDALVVGNRSGAVSPYLGLGLGAVRTDYKFYDGVTSGFDTRLAIETEVGLMVKLWESAEKTSKISLRPELKMRLVDPGKTNDFDFLYMVGIQWSFGGSPVVAAAPPPPPPPYAERSSITLEGVNFAFNKADLTPDSKPVLDGVADGLKKHPRVKVEIQGHTDGVGKPAYNLQLSQRRAQAVLDYLATDGVSADQMVAKGYGMTQPIASNKTAEGRAQNRRVVMYVLSNPADVKVKGQGTAQDSPSEK
jgi:OOP family OmpA-OmpF porin